MATPSTFSYAQAAKGQGATSITSPPNPSAQAQAPQPGSSATKMPNGSADSPDSCSADVCCSTLEKQDVGSSDCSENDTHFEAASEHTPDIKRVDVATRLERPWRRTDTGSKSSTAAVPSVDECEPRKPHKASKSKGSSTQAIDLPLGTDQEQEAVREVPKLELSEAPIPTVNIWKKRQEAQLAKTKTILIRNEELANGGPGKSKDTKTLARSGPEPSSLLRHNSSINGARPTHKASDVARSERNGRRGSRADERDVKGGDAELPPSVEDAATWPTPETAILENKKKLGFSGADRQEKEHKESQDEGTQPKSRQKGRWVTYDYVPTASFDTQLPQIRNSRPRGGARAINGTRIVPGTVGGDGKSTPATQTGRPGDSIRERSLEATTTNGTASAAPTAKRASIDACFSKDQKRAVGLASVDKSKPISQAPEQTHGKQDRLEGRGERGRGGYRGRGGHHSISNHSQHQQSTSSGYATGPMSSRPQGPYSPPSRQGGHNQMAMGHQQRGGRGRNGAGTNIHRMSLPNGSMRLAPVQTQFSSYEQQPMAPLSAMPYPSQPGWENVVPSLVKHQIEYYFSIDNLCKDMYLRQRMDSQGFVNLHFVAAFKRIRQLTSDINTIRAACEWSTEIDFVTGEDDVERVRRRVKWQDFVLPVEKRDLFARNSGPAQITFKNRPSGYGTPFGGIPQFGGSPSLGYNLHNEALFPSFANGYTVNGAVSDGGSRHGGASQLSADVPDFSPLGSAMTSNSMVESIVAFSGEVEKQNEAKVNGHGNETIAEEMPTENDSNRPQS